MWRCEAEVAWWAGGGYYLDESETDLMMADIGAFNEAIPGNHECVAASLSERILQWFAKVVDKNFNQLLVCKFLVCGLAVYYKMELFDHLSVFV